MSYIVENSTIGIKILGLDLVVEQRGDPGECEDSYLQTWIAKKIPAKYSKNVFCGKHTTKDMAINLRKFSLISPKSNGKHL